LANVHLAASGEPVPVVTPKNTPLAVAPTRGMPWAMIIMLVLLGIFSTVAILHFLGVIYLNELL
jgi:hypothetical protein